MSDSYQSGSLSRVANDTVWRYTRIVFLAATLIFLVNIGLGFLNAMADGAIPRWQILVHVHSGTVGWITLSAIGVTLWLFTGGREVSRTYANRVRWLVWLTVLAFLGLIASFGLGFAEGMMNLLGIFGPVAALTIWVIAVFALWDLRNQDVVTTPHLSMALGLLVAAVATSVGGLVALSHAEVISIDFDAALLGHVGGVEGYLILLATGVIEWLILGRAAETRSRAGTIQAALGAILGLMFPIGYLAVEAGVTRETFEMAVNVGFLLGLIVFALLFLYRVGLRALKYNPLDYGVGAWTFFGSLWFVGAVLMWPARVALENPDWWIPVYAHLVFVGVVTNLVFGVVAAYRETALQSHAWLEPAALWVMNVGMVLFLVPFVAMDVRHGAFLMGIGVVLGVVSMILRFQEPITDANAPPEAGTGSAE